MTAGSQSNSWRIIALLFVSVGVNYVDRGLLSVSAPVLAKELALTPTQLGLLFSAFFWSYAAFQVIAGWLVDRYEVKWIYAAGYLLWSLATAATGFLSQFGALLGARLALGIGESVAYPACSQIIVRNFPERRRGLANALIDVGSKAGPGLSTLIGGLLVEQYGWRALFIAVGAGSVLWLLPWVYWVPGQRATRKQEAEARPEQRPDAGGPGVLDILKRREAWGTSIGLFSLGYVWYFLLSWLPTYLVNERQFSMEKMAIFGSLPFWAMGCSSLAGGWASDRWIGTGASPTLVRKTFVVLGLLLCACFMVPAALVSRASLSVALLIGSCISLGIFTSNVWAITQTLAGPSAAGKWTGIQNALGNLGGVVSPFVTGLVVAKTGSFLLAFVSSSIVVLVGAASFLTLVGEIKPLAWTRKEAELAVEV